MWCRRKGPDVLPTPFYRLCFWVLVLLPAIKLALLWVYCKVKGKGQPQPFAPEARTAHVVCLGTLQLFALIWVPGVKIGDFWFLEYVCTGLREVLGSFWDSSHSSGT